MSRKILLVVGALAVFASSQAFGAEGAKTYEASGEIVKLDSSRVTVQAGAQSFEFDRADKDLALPPDAKIGDRVTIWYKLDATKSKIVPRQQAGEVAPSDEDSTPKSTTPVIDDRAFFPA